MEPEDLIHGKIHFTWRPNRLNIDSVGIALTASLSKLI